MSSEIQKKLASLRQLISEKGRDAGDVTTPPPPPPPPPAATTAPTTTPTATPTTTARGAKADPGAEPPKADPKSSGSVVKGGTSSSGSSSGGTSAPAKEAPALNAFLAKMIEKGKIANSNTSAVKVRGEKKFGPEGTKALKQFFTSLMPNLIVKTGRTFDDSTRKDAVEKTIRKALKELSDNSKAAKTADLGKWTGASVGLTNFTSDPAGLTDFLKFAYVMCADGNVDALLTDVEIDKADMNAQPSDPPQVALRFVGAITPYKFLEFISPTGQFTSGSSVNISIAQTSFDLEAGAGGTDPTNIAINIPSNFQGTIRFKVGKAGEEKTTVQGAKADALVQAGVAQGQATTFTLKMDGKDYTQPINSYKAGDTISFAQPAAQAAPGAAEPGAAAAKPASFATLAGNLVGRTQQGKTEEGEKAFSLRSIFKMNNGRLNYETVPAKMIKDVGKRDSFTLRVSNPRPSPSGVIFVPVSLPQKIQEVSHWTARFIVPTDDVGGGEEAPTFALMPVTEIGFNFDSNYADYGAADLPTVSTVSFVPYDQPFKSPGLNVMTSAELLEADVTQEAQDAAVRDFLISKDNLLGGGMIATMTVLNAMNSFPQRTYRF